MMERCHLIQQGSAERNCVQAYERANHDTLSNTSRPHGERDF